MPAWSWWLIFGGIVVLAIVVFAVLGRTLWRRAKVLFGDVQRLAALAESLEAATSGVAPALGTPGRPAGPGSPIGTPMGLSVGRHRAHP